MRVPAPIGAALAAAAVLGMSAVATGCDPTKPKKLATPCGVVVDGSASGTKLNARQLLDDHIIGFLVGAKCRRVAFAPITGASEESKCAVPDVDVDPDGPAGEDVDATRNAERLAARSAAERMLGCAKTDRNPGSDIVGGLRRIVTDRPDGAGTYRVLVISDFGQSDSTMSLYHEPLDRPKVRDELIHKLDSAGRIPDLHDVRLTTYGFALQISNDPGRRGSFEAFWTQLITGPAKGTKPKYT